MPGFLWPPDGCGAYIVNLTGDVEQKLVADNPYYAFATIPAGTYKTTSDDVTTFGVMATFVSRTRTSPRTSSTKSSGR